MLLRGVKFAPPALDNADIQATKSRAQHTGRSFGGAPFRGGRGGRMNYGGDRGGGDRGSDRGGDNRPNPFAAHLDPKFMPGGNPAAIPSGWAPPSASGNFSRGPPPPPRGGYGQSYGSYNPGHGQQRNYQQPNYGQGDYYGRGPPGQYNNGPADQYGRPSGYEPRGGGYSRGGYRGGRDNYSSRNQGGYGRY